MPWDVTLEDTNNVSNTKDWGMDSICSRIRLQHFRCRRGRERRVLLYVLLEQRLSLLLLDLERTCHFAFHRTHHLTQIFTQGKIQTRGSNTISADLRERWLVRSMFSPTRILYTRRIYVVVSPASVTQTFHPGRPRLPLCIEKIKCLETFVLHLWAI